MFQTSNSIGKYLVTFYDSVEKNQNALFLSYLHRLLLTCHLLIFSLFRCETEFSDPTSLYKRKQQEHTPKFKAYCETCFKHIRFHQADLIRKHLETLCFWSGYQKQQRRWDSRLQLVDKKCSLFFSTQISV